MLGSLILYNKGMRIIMFPTFWLLLYTKIQVARRALTTMMILITIVNPRQLEHGCRRLSARIPYTLQ